MAKLEESYLKHADGIIGALSAELREAQDELGRKIYARVAEAATEARRQALEEAAALARRFRPEPSLHLAQRRAADEIARTIESLARKPREEGT